MRTGVRGKASVSYAAKGKAIASGNNVVKEITFKDVTSVPMKASAIRLIHFGRLGTSGRRRSSAWRCSSSIFFGSKSKPIYRVADRSDHCFSWNSVLSLIEELCPFSDDRYRVHGSRNLALRRDLRPTRAEGVSRDKAASSYVRSSARHEGTARVILVTTLNQRFGGLCSKLLISVNMLDESLLCLLWRLHGSFWIMMSRKPEFTSAGKAELEFRCCQRVNAEVITKPEPASLGELFSYMKKATAKVAWFECTATIDAVVHGSEWYYIGCAVCHTKATRGPTTLMFISKLSVYDHNDQGVFVLLGDAGEELTGKKAGELVEGYYQANEGLEGDHMVPVPQAMIDTIGRTAKPRASLGEEVDEEPMVEVRLRGEEAVKRGTDVSVPGGVKRARCG
ncbi:hypothetical protein Bca52824_093833 [Brassica carinata]|uniref:Uncharacterized protein n=1 Tax=Brassica carinata TaxID=52824 RepID=A0A8X7P5I3_BRACI|nr:hypothetical protein Bca52824_093833 [Brassica carinata]